jgi:hypothetical protein
MRTLRNAIFLGLTLGGLATGACSNESTNTGPGVPGAPPDSANHWGMISARLELGPGVTLSAVSYTITNTSMAGFTALTASVDVSNSQAIGFSLALPAGGGYSIALTATDSDGDSCVGGPTSFSVLGGQTSTVALGLVCSEVGDGGGLVGPDVNPGTVVIAVDASLTTTTTAQDCAAATSLVAAPNRIDVGHSIALSASGIDPSFQSSDVTLTWGATGSAGSLSGTTGTSNVFSCTAPGSTTVTVTAAISNGGSSCPGTGSLAVALECDATSDASAPVEASAPEASTPEASTPEASTPEASAPEASAPEASAPETGAPETGSGALVACTSAGQTGCVGCYGSTDNVCTATEAVFIALDIAKGRVTAAGPEADDGTACYSCLVDNTCLNSPANFITGTECGDLTGSFTNASGTVDAMATCQAVLTCITGPTGQNCAGSATGLSDCYCGADGGPSAQCQGANASKVDGPCIDQEVAGFAYAKTDAADILAHFGSSQQPSGVANDVFACAISNHCASCL